MNDQAITENFKKHFSAIPRLFKAPGRVNLIGEHTDYNDGFVFPMAIDRYTMIAIAPRTDAKLELFSANMNDSVSIDLDQNLSRKGHWSDYVAGVVKMLLEKGIKVAGANVLIHSDVPVGSGLSSSAAIEMSAALAFLALAHRQMSNKEIALLGQKAENQFVGMNCGIMDQFISIHGEKDHALFLDCRSLEYQLVPLPSEQVRIVICNTMVKHKLGSSEYNKRRAECESGVRIMQADYPGIKALRDVTLQQFGRVEAKLPELERKRCRHVISEDERALESIQALKSNDFSRFGQLMNASHDSLKEDYEVSCQELDVMVDIARTLPGVLGARMTGGGFGGCTVNLVQVDQVKKFCADVAAQYEKATGIEPKIYVSVPSQGAHEVKVQN